MDIQSFVAESLTQIAKGIRKAQKAGTGALVCPPASGREAFKNGEGAQVVSFDICVSVETEKDNGAEHLTVRSAHIDNAPKTTGEIPALSRISFTIPVVWPESGYERASVFPEKSPGNLLDELDISL